MYGSAGIQLWLLPKVPFALFKSSIGAARLLGLFAANYSLGVFLSSSTSRSFLGKCAGLVCCKTGGGAGCFRFMGGARTIILSIKLRWRNRVDLNRDHRFSRDTEMPCNFRKLLVFKRIMMQLL